LRFERRALIFLEKSTGKKPLCRFDTGVSVATIQRLFSAPRGAEVVYWPDADAFLDAKSQHDNVKRTASL
jgi:hypothetical protein